MAEVCNVLGGYIISSSGWWVHAVVAADRDLASSWHGEGYWLEACGGEMPRRGEALLFSPNTTMVGYMPSRVRHMHGSTAQCCEYAMPCSCTAAATGSQL